MSRPPTREEAARALGVAVSADPDVCKRAYRRLAREHHPDVGGDPETFQTLREAYDRLTTDPDRSVQPVVSRGTPSRRPVTFVDDPEVADTSKVDWATPLPEGRLRLDRSRLAVWLAEGLPVSSRPDDPARVRDVGEPPHRAPFAMVRALTASSRAPGSHLNRAAHLLAPELTSRLRVGDGRDDRGHPQVAIELVGGNRRARRALDRVALRGAWVRTRRSTTTLLRATLDPSRDPRVTAVRVTDRVDQILEELDWPLDCWSVDRP